MSHALKPTATALEREFLEVDEIHFGEGEPIFPSNHRPPWPGLRIRELGEAVTIEAPPLLTRNSE